MEQNLFVGNQWFKTVNVLDDHQEWNDHKNNQEPRNNNNIIGLTWLALLFVFAYNNYKTQATTYIGDLLKTEVMGDTLSFANPEDLDPLKFPEGSLAKDVADVLSGKITDCEIIIDIADKAEQTEEFVMDGKSEKLLKERVLGCMKEKVEWLLNSEDDKNVSLAIAILAWNEELANEFSVIQTNCDNLMILYQALENEDIFFQNLKKIELTDDFLYPDILHAIDIGKVKFGLEVICPVMYVSMYWLPEILEGLKEMHESAQNFDMENLTVYVTDKSIETELMKEVYKWVKDFKVTIKFPNATSLKIYDRLYDWASLLSNEKFLNWLIDKSPNLTKIVIRHNSMKEVPSSLWKLSKLKFLDLWNNNISYFPDFLFNLSQTLTYLELENNKFNLSHEEEEIISKQFPNLDMKIF